jgi:hypothetical protein
LRDFLGLSEVTGVGCSGPLGTFKAPAGIVETVLFETASRHVIELQAGGPEDPGGLRAATVLSAYFHAQHMRAFRQLLWRRLAALGSAWFIVGTLTSLFSRVALIGGLAMFAAIAIGAAAAEWRAEGRLRELLRVESAIARTRSLSSPARRSRRTANGSETAVS